MKANETLSILRRRGYWRVHFRPLVAEEKLGLPSLCRNIVTENKVYLRGWDYPHIPERTGDDVGLEPGANFYQSWIDSGAFKEFWRMYQSGQFIHYFAVRMDWWGEDEWYRDMADKYPAGSALSVVDTIYQITEIFEFLSRLARAGIYDEGVNVSIALNNTLDRKLVILQSDGRFPFVAERKSVVENVSFPHDGFRKYGKDQLLTEVRDLAKEVIIHIFELFRWENPPTETIEGEQNKLLSGRILTS